MMIESLLAIGYKTFFQILSSRSRVWGSVGILKRLLRIVREPWDVWANLGDSSSPRQMSSHLSRFSQDLLLRLLQSPRICLLD